MTELLSIDEVRSALGMEPWTTFKIVTDALGRKWDDAKHPRDRKGRFIETGGVIKLFDGETPWGTAEVIATPNVGTVTAKITASPNFPDMVGKTVNVDPATSEQVKAKATLGKPATFTPPTPQAKVITPNWNLGDPDYDSIAQLRALLPKNIPGYSKSNLSTKQKTDLRNAGFALDDAIKLTPGSGEHRKSIERAAFLLNRGGYNSHANNLIERELPDDTPAKLNAPPLPTTPALVPQSYRIPSGKAIDLHWDDPDVMGKLAQWPGDMHSHSTIGDTSFDVGEIYRRPYKGWSKQLLYHGKGSHTQEYMRLLAIKEDENGDAVGVFRDADTNSIVLEKLNDPNWTKAQEQATLLSPNEAVVDPQDPDAHLPGEIEPPPTSTPNGEAPLTPTDGPNPEQYPYGPEVKTMLDQLEEAQSLHDDGDTTSETWNDVVNEAQAVYHDLPLHGTPNELKDSLIKLNDTLDYSHYGDGISTDDSAAFGKAQEQIDKIIKEIDDELDSVNPSPPPEEDTPDATPDGPLDPTGWEKIGGQGGSNPGGTYRAPDGKEYYVKQSKSEQHAKVESLASDFYQAAGIDIPKVHLTTDGGVASEIVPGSQQDLKKHLNDPEYLAKIQEGFATDAWLSNWDVAGLVFDNVVTGDDGKPYRIDTGGTLLYRAMGSPKGGAFGNTVGEIDTLRDPQMGPQAYKLFGNMTDADIAESAKRVMAITPGQIDELVDAKGFDPDVADELKQKLKSRRMDLAQRFGLTALADEIKPVESKAEIPDSPFHIIPDTGLNGDGYHASGPWGKFGAAGVMVRHVEDDGTEKFLMVQRGNGVSSNKGKWQLPGGALDSNEDPYQGIARETSEELGASDEYLANMAPVGETIFDNGKGWQYTSVAADVPEKFDAVVDGWETGASDWFTRQQIEDMKNNGQLNPAFASGVDALLDKWDTPTPDVTPEPAPAQSGLLNDYFDNPEEHVYTIQPGTSLGWGFVQLLEDQGVSTEYEAHIDDTETAYAIEYENGMGGWTVYSPDGEPLDAIGNDFESYDEMAESIDNLIAHDIQQNTPPGGFTGNFIPATVEASPPPQLYADEWDQKWNTWPTGTGPGTIDGYVPGELPPKMYHVTTPENAALIDNEGLTVAYEVGNPQGRVFMARDADSSFIESLYMLDPGTAVVYEIDTSGILGVPSFDGEHAYHVGEDIPVAKLKKIQPAPEQVQSFQEIKDDPAKAIADLEAKSGPSLPGANGKPIHVGTKVVSVTDGSVGEVVAFETNGTGVRVKMADGKVKGRKAHKLNALEEAPVAGYNAPPANDYEIQDHGGAQYVVVPDDKKLSDVAEELWVGDEFPYHGFTTNEGYTLEPSPDGTWTLLGPQNDVIADGYTKEEILTDVVDDAIEESVPEPGPGSTPSGGIASKLKVPNQHAYWLGTDEQISDWMSANLPPGTDINDLHDGMQIGSDDGYTLELDKASNSWNLTGPNNENIDTFDYNDGTPEQIQQVIDDYKNNGEPSAGPTTVESSLDELSKEAWNIENGFGHNDNIIATKISKLNKINTQWKQGILTEEEVKQELMSIALEIEFGPNYDYDTDQGLDALKDLINGHVQEITDLSPGDPNAPEPGEGFQGQLMPDNIRPSEYMAMAEWDGNDFLTPDGYKIQNNAEAHGWDVINPSGQHLATLKYADVMGKIDKIIKDDKDKPVQLPVQNPQATDTLDEGTSVDDLMNSNQWSGGTIVTPDGYQVTFGPGYGAAFVWDKDGKAIDSKIADPATGQFDLGPNGGGTLGGWVDSVIQIDKDNKAGVGPPDDTYNVATGASVAEFMESGDWTGDVTTQDGYKAEYTFGTAENNHISTFKITAPDGKEIETLSFNESLTSESMVGEQIDDVINKHKDPVSAVIPFSETWAPGSNAKPVFVGSKVKSVTDGEVFTVKSFEPNGDGVKVIDANGKVKGRKLSKLTAMDPPPEWWTPKHPKTYAEYAHKVQVAKGKATGDQPTSTHAYEPYSPGKASVPVYKPTLETDPSSPWYGQAKPDTPTKEYAGAVPWVPDGWLEKAKETYLLKPDKASANLEASKRWGVVKKVMDEGDTASLDLLLAKKYIDQDLHDSAMKQINASRKTNEEADKIFQVEMQKYKADVVEWKKANGIDTAAFPGAPPLSTEAFWGGPPDWTKAYPGTPTGNAALEAVKSDVGVAHRGASFATDSGELRDLNVRAMRVIDRDGYEKLEFKFHIHDSASENVATTMTAKGAKSEKGMHSDQATKDKATGLRKYTSGFKHTSKTAGTTRVWTDPSTGARVQFTREDTYPGINSTIYHNQVRIFLPADADASDFETTLRNIGIKDAGPATPEAVQKLKEDQLMQIGSGSFSERHTPVGTDRAKRLGEIKQKYGITVDDVEMVTDELGFVRPMLQQDAAEKLVKYTGTHGLIHNVYSGGDEATWMSIFSGHRLGLIPTGTRWAEGIGGSGSSQTSDMKNRGSMSIFTRKVQSPITTVGGHTIVMHPLAALRRMQFHGSNHDAYGKYSEKQNLWDMLKGNPTEMTYEHGIPIGDMWYASIPEPARSSVISQLMAEGITEINGIPLEEFFVLSGGKPPVVDGTSWILPTAPVVPPVGAPAAGPAV